MATTMMPFGTSENGFADVIRPQGYLQSPNAIRNLLVEYSGFRTNGRFSQKNPMDLTYIRNPGIETQNSRFEI
jgi:hypothetical protein